MAITPCLSIITLNSNGLNSPIKRHRVPEWILKSRIQQYAEYLKLNLALRTHIGWKWIYGKRYSMWIVSKDSRGPILLSDTLNFQSKSVTRDKEEHHYEGVHLSRGYKNYNIYTKHWST